MRNSCAWSHAQVRLHCKSNVWLEDFENIFVLVMRFRYFCLFVVYNKQFHHTIETVKEQVNRKYALDRSDTRLNENTTKTTKQRK